jgi:ATP-dependent DNA ligase
MIVLAYNGSGTAKPCFESVISRLNAKRPQSIKVSIKNNPAHMPAFDILYLNGKDLLKTKLEDRISILEDLISP